MLKKIICVFMLMLISVNFRVYAEENLTVSAKAAVLYDPVAKEVVFEHNAYEEYSMASTTKVMTSLILCEYIEENGDSEHEMTMEMVMVEGSSMGLKAGDRVHLSDLIVGMLLPSGNDAANATAIILGGDTENFAKLMNEKAKEIGMEKTSFVTPSGLDDEMHYSTAFDMALLTAEAFKNQMFREVYSSEKASVRYYSIDHADMLTVTFTNHNKLIGSYEYCVGGKTGFTKKSGRCLVSTSVRDGTELVAVTLNAPDDWNDHTNMYDYAYQKLESTVFPSRELTLNTAEGNVLEVIVFESTLSYFTGQEVSQIVYLPKFIYETGLLRGAEIGSIHYYINEELVKTMSIIY